MPRDEITNKRPSILSAVFRKHDKERLADWTRHIDCDWRWYCPHCGAIVILIEEKMESSLARSWNVTRRAATGHKDRPWAWMVICRADGDFDITAARVTDAHEVPPPQTLTEDRLISWIERAFVRHYVEAGHPENLIPERVRA